MRVRRCGLVTIEPTERLAFDLARLAAGGTGLYSIAEWMAAVPHADREVRLTMEQVIAVGRFSPTAWTDHDALRETFSSPDALADLIEKGPIVVEGSESDRRDRALRDAEWRGHAAVMHYTSRWRGVDTEAVQRQFVEHFEDDLLDRLGPAPPPVRERSSAAERIRLPKAEPSPLDRILDRRVTCRNFDAEAYLTREQFAAVLYRAYGARAVDHYAPGIDLLKKAVPSAGGLHPTEAYVLVRSVRGLAPGMYHYHPVEHALEPIRTISPDEALALAHRFVGAQSYLVGAQAFVIPASRFRRNFWKYRNHSKAYRALILDVGHLSQTMYLAATELGLGAFITAAVNEVDIEQAFGLDPLEEGPLAVTGFGMRGAERNEIEFDPLNAVWPAS
ncbi:MAG TPA: putative peptide maturation dehydrogenase [Dokdonella sp.]|nr:putative peptide maturation dehydrogenase [Dokdonella sp.]